MHFKVPHKTTKTEAKQKIKNAIEEARPMMKGQAEITGERWDGDTLFFTVLLQGKEITGSVEVTDMDMIVNATLPLMWRLFEGRIEREIAQQLSLRT